MSLIKRIYLEQDGFVLSVPSMEVLDEGVTALVGPSGSGKSTLIRVLLGLQPLKGWSWVKDGVEISELPIEKRNFGVVFQSLELFPHMSAYENVLFSLACRKKVSNEDRDLTLSMMDRLGVLGCQSRRPDKLSGGEKQRVALARALVFKPSFLFLDEPFSSLDEENKASSRELVKQILEEQKVAALLVSHDKDDIQSLSNKTHFIRDGHL